MLTGITVGFVSALGKYDDAVRLGGYHIPAELADFCGDITFAPSLAINTWTLEGIVSEELFERCSSCMVFTTPE